MGFRRLNGSSSQQSPCVQHTRQWYSVFFLEATLPLSHHLSEPSLGSETSLWQMLRKAHCGSQLPIRPLFVDRIRIQPCITQQAVTIVSTVARQTGRSYAKQWERETRVQHSDTDHSTMSDRKSLQCSHTATRSILNVSPVFLYTGGNLVDTGSLELPQWKPPASWSLP